MEFVANTVVPSCRIDRPDTNTRRSFTVVPAFAPSDPKSDIVRSPAGSPGSYLVTFVLAVPGKEVFRSDLDIPKIMAAGDSLLLLPKGLGVKSTIIGGGQTAEILLLPSENGALGRAQIRVTKESFAAAEQLANDLVLPLLSWWSFRYDVALDVAGYEVLEEYTDVKRWVFGFLGKTKLLTWSDSEPAMASKPEYRALFAAYREASSATNPFYRFLCFYRVVEGVRNLRSVRHSHHKGSGKAPIMPTEKMPASAVGLAVDSLEKEFFQPYFGKKFTVVVDQLRPMVRNALAHLNPTGNSIVADKFEDVSTCERAVPVIKYLAREMLRNELATDPDTAGVKPL